ncbi:MAG: hypothetical protein CVV30_04055 [Methanomicrobiales archaeon HGW-Methanomicrobiales-1]|jgi:hypothetical protein|nr:MAG: hypothetical protein CVV30_04055 [Methanomicrobiales archaeon HGW-Methanomicrobiales-1]
MDKKDIMYMAGALCIILIIALVIKPIMTGQPVNTGIVTATPQPTEISVTLQTANISHKIVTVITTIPVPTSTPTPVPTWDKNVSSVVFVNPSTYGVSFNQSLPGGTRIDSITQNKSMTTIAKISGQYSGTTEIMNIPFPYWEMWYTVDPFTDMGGKEQSLSSSSVTGSKQSGEKSIGSAQVIQGSFSVMIPSFTVQVMDGDDPNRIIRTITPPGGLDKALWKGKSVESDYSGSVNIPDPRPWKEKFFEGNRNYFFIINTHAINSYGIEIRVPSEYIK